MQRTPEEKAAREGAAQEEFEEEVAKIRRSGYNPPEALVDWLRLNHGPERALQMLRAAAYATRKLVSVH